MAIEFADSNRGRIAYQREAEFGEAQGSFAGQIARITSSSLIANKGTTVSDELRADAMVSDLIETDFSTGGDLGAELSLGNTWLDFLQTALRYDISTTYAVYSGTSLTVSAASRTYTASTGSPFIASSPGDFIYATGFTNEDNNGWKRIDDVIGVNEVTVFLPNGYVLEDEGPIAQPDGDVYPIQNDVGKYSYNIEQYFSDIDIAQLFLGQRLGTWSMSTSAGAVVAMTWGFMGTSVQAKDGVYVSSTLPPTDTEVIGATANIARIEVNEEALDCQVQSLDINLDNSLRVQNAVGDKFPCGIGYGRQTITGSMTVYFQDVGAYNDFINHTDVGIIWEYVDAVGNSMLVKLPRVKYTAGSPSLEGIDTDVTLSLDFQALAKPLLGQPDRSVQIEIGMFVAA